MSQILSTSYITQLIDNYKYNEQVKQVNPITVRKSKYSNLSLTWNSLKTKLSSFSTVLSDMKSTSSSSLFNTKKATLSSSDFFTASAEKTASINNYEMRVLQLAKNDLLVSDTMVSGTSVTTLAGNHTFSVSSGNYSANVDVELTASETNSSIMTKIASAINNSKATINSSTFDANSTFTGAGQFKIVIGDTQNSEDVVTSTISYDYQNKTYSEIMEDLVSQLSLINGVQAEKVIDGSNVGIKITGKNSAKYISMQAANDTGGLLSNLNVDAEKVIGASGLATSAIFSPSTGSSKISFSAKNSGYDNRLVLSDVTGSALSSIGLSSVILANRTIAADDNTAGYKYSAESSTNNELNSKMVFNGINIQRNSNSFSDLITGVTFNLKAVMDEEDQSVSMNITNDVDTVKTKIESFIKSFNESYSFIRANQTAGANTTRGVFTGDSTANSLKSKLQSAVLQSVTGLSAGNVTRLADIGVTFDPETGLSMSDTAKLTEQINKDPDQVAELFNSNNGIAQTLYSTLETYLGPDGTISRLTDSLDNNANYLKDRIDGINKRIDKGAEVLRSKYEALQMQLATLMTSYNNMSSMFGSY